MSQDDRVCCAVLVGFSIEQTGLVFLSSPCPPNLLRLLSQKKPGLKWLIRCYIFSTCLPLLPLFYIYSVRTLTLFSWFEMFCCVVLCILAFRINYLLFTVLSSAPCFPVLSSTSYTPTSSMFLYWCREVDTLLVTYLCRYIHNILLDGLVKPLQLNSKCSKTT